MKHLDGILKEVIQEAREINIPVPDNISEKIIVNSRPKKRFGCCRKKEGSFHIEVSSFILQCPENKIRQTIAHELLHTCEGCYEHGKVWKHYATLMNSRYGYNIKRTSSFEEMGLPEEKNDEDIKYIIRCKQCGREYPRRRFTCVMQKINAYRCSCGGKLELIKLEGE